MHGVANRQSHWEAEIRLVYRQHGLRTVLAERRHRGPLVVQRPFYPEGNVCHTYLLHPPGGVVGGDRLSVEVQVAQHAHALITTPASGKFYRSNAGPAHQCQRLYVEDAAVLEWLPQDMILFRDAQVQTRTIVNVTGTGRFAGWEIICQGRPASAEPFASGMCRQCLELYRDGQPLLIERTHLQGESALQSAQWGLAGYPVMATLLITDADTDLLTRAREVTAATRVRYSATLLGDVLVCRYLGYQGIEARQHLARVWASLREAWIGKTPCPPRIWNT